MAGWSRGEQGDQFMVCLFRRNEKDDEGCFGFINALEDSVRQFGGRVQMRSDQPQDWDVVDGRDHFIEPNHLNPPIFDFNSVMVCGFPDSATETVNVWWNSDPVFQLMKKRHVIPKMGIFIVPGLIQAVDIFDPKRSAFGDKFVLLELCKMQAFRPMQRFADDYKRLSEGPCQDVGVDMNLVFSETVTGVLLGEFPLEAIVASSWRMKTDALFWYDSDLYQRQLLTTRKDYSVSLAIVIPLVDEKAPWIKNRSTKMKSLAGLLA